MKITEKEKAFVEATNEMMKKLVGSDPKIIAILETIEEECDIMQKVYIMNTVKAGIVEEMEVYKNMARVIEASKDTITDIEIGRPIYNFKAKGE